MAINKVVYNNNTLIDLTADTVQEDKLLKGYTAHDKKGNKITGTYEESQPTGTKTITANGTYDVTDYANATVNVPIPSGYIKPSGTKYITTTSSVDVTSYATAKISSSTLVADNIKKGISILGVTGTYEGAGGSGGSDGGSAELTIKLNSELSLSDRCFYSIYFKCAAPDASGAETSGYSVATTDFPVFRSFEETFSVKPNSMFTIIMIANEEWGSKFNASTTYTINGERYPSDYSSDDYTFFDASITPPANSTGVFTINITKN